MRGWIGVDLDGTLAEYNGWDGGKIGAPIPKMVARVKRWLAEGIEVRIMTARISPKSRREQAWVDIAIPIQNWCREHLGTILCITHEKDMAMMELWDDRAVQVIPNTGERADGKAE